MVLSSFPGPPYVIVFLFLSVDFMGLFILDTWVSMVQSLQSVLLMIGTLFAFLEFNPNDTRLRSTS